MVRAYSSLASAMRPASSRTSSRSGVTRSAFSDALSASSKSPWRKLASPRSYQRLEIGGQSASEVPAAAQPQMMTDEPMTATKPDANTELNAYLNIDTWTQNLYPHEAGQPKASRR